MKKMIKIMFSVFLSISLASTLLMNNVNANPDDDPEYSTLSTGEKIEYYDCLSRLSMNYTINYRLDGSYSSLTGGSTKLFSLNLEINNQTSYNKNFAASPGFTLDDDCITVEVSKNSCTSDYVVFTEDNGLRLDHASDGNGAEIVIKMIDTRVIELVSFPYSECNEVTCEITSNALNEPIKEYDTQYRYSLNDECYELRIKNTSTTNDAYIKALYVDTSHYTCNVTSFDFKKNSNDKYMSSIQFVGRIPASLYQEIYDTYGESDQILFGMLYGRRDKVSDTNIDHDILYLKNYDIYTTDYCSTISEIYYDNLQGYDSNCLNKVSDNPSYYQWGVTISNISYDMRNTQIIAIPYVRIRKTSNGDYWVYCLKEKTISLSEMCTIYSNSNDLDANSLDKKVIDYLKSSN